VYGGKRAARDYGERGNVRVILIDGAELARLMIEHGCGFVMEATYTLKQAADEWSGHPGGRKPSEFPRPTGATD
jgi:restriction endonuclease Mrr